ncbi:hypothetical protein OROMI_008918 [Orobanche minor]
MIRRSSLTTFVVPSQRRHHRSFDFHISRSELLEVVHRTAVGPSHLFKATSVSPSASIASKELAMPITRSMSGATKKVEKVPDASYGLLMSPICGDDDEEDERLKVLVTIRETEDYVAKEFEMELKKDAEPAAEASSEKITTARSSSNEEKLIKSPG